MLSPETVDGVMIGTITNAAVQRRDLAPTAAVRRGSPATASLPEDLSSAIGDHACLAQGGHELAHLPSNARRVHIKVIGGLHVA